MQKRKNHRPTSLEIMREHVLNMLDDIFFLQNIHAHIGFRHIAALVYLLSVAIFLYLTLMAFVGM